MPTFFKDDINVDVVQHNPRLDPVLGRSDSPTNGAMWYDSASNSFHGVINGVVGSIGGGGGNPAFSAITAGTNTGQALHVGNTSTLDATGSGTITATAVPFGGVAAGTNANALVIGTGGSLTTSGTGTISATPGGSATQVQFNNAGVFGGIAGSSTANGGVRFISQNINNIPLACDSVGGLNVSYFEVRGSGSLFFFIDTSSRTHVTGSLLIDGSGAGAVTGAMNLGFDSTTNTMNFNVNNTISTSPSGAWNNTNLTPVTVAANVTTDQNLMSASVPAGTLNRVGRSLRVWCAGVYSTPAAQTEIITVKVKFGALTLISIPIPSQSFTATNNQFNISALLSTQTNGATGVFESHGNLVIDLGIGNLVADSVFADQNTAVSGTIDLTAAQTLQITVAYSVASTSNTTTQRQMVLETIG